MLFRSRYIYVFDRYHFYWIEGVGSNLGVLQYIPFCGYSESLLCYHEDGEVVLALDSPCYQSNVDRVLCEAAGFDTVFVETVGVGQSETAVHSMVDFFLLIQLAGTGDELQGIKRGIMEMADGIVINKADGDNIERAKMAEIGRAHV